MKRLFSYNGINTKVRAMDSNLISAEDYIKISNFDSTSDLIAFLKRHPGYSGLFDKYQENIHRDQAERLFFQGLFLDFTRIYRFANKEQRSMLDLIFFRYEINAMKACIRFVYSDIDTYDTILFHPFFKKHSKVNISVLSQCHSMKEYVETLKGTQYYHLLNKLLENDKATSFDYQMYLDIYYCTKSWRLKDKLLSGDNLKAFTHRLGTEIDLLNIMCIYRAKKVFDINSNDLFTYLIPINYRLTKDQLARMVVATALNDFTNILMNTHYKEFNASLKDGTMEAEFNNILNKVYGLQAMKYPSSMSVVNYYLHRKSKEIDRLTTALECVRYGLDPKEKLNLILQQ